MRLSVDTKDPGARHYAMLQHAGICPEVTLDGRPMPDCVTADDVEGYVLTYEPDAEGRPFLNADKSGVQMIALRGKVEIVLKWTDCQKPRQCCPSRCPRCFDDGPICRCGILKDGHTHECEKYNAD